MHKGPMRRIILKCDDGPTANVLLTAAVRDLDKLHPELFHIDVRTRYPELWRHNPHLVRLVDADPEVELIDCDAPRPEHILQSPSSVTHSFLRYFNTIPDVNIAATAFCGDLHLSAKEKAWISQVQELTRVRIPFWLVSTGARSKETVKRWEPRRFQAVIDGFRDRVLFVQVGLKQDYGPTLDGVIDLRGRTDLRQLIRLVYHAQGLLSTSNLLIHLAAATPTRRGDHNRACVVIAGGSQPPQWQPYLTHQCLHTVGALACCNTSGCGRIRTYRVADGSPDDLPENLCVDPVGDLPRCMYIIDEGKVIRTIERYFNGGLLEYLSEDEIQVARATVAAGAGRINPAPPDASAIVLPLTVAPTSYL
jgi:hypothetical protein